MKIDTVGQHADRVTLLVHTSAGIKFVIENAVPGKITHLFDGGKNDHINMVQNHADFLGAGWVKNGGKIIEYGSNSCVHKLGRDRPADSAEASQLIDELRLAVVAWLKTIP